MKEYIEREAAIKNFMQYTWYDDSGKTIDDGDEKHEILDDMFSAIPAADVVPWEWLERYADYFYAGVSMPEFIREAKMFYESTNEAMQGGVIDG